MMRLALPIALVLAGCSPVQSPSALVPKGKIAQSQPLPPMKMFGAAQPDAPVRSNRDMARDYLDLAFTLESGRSVKFFTRVEGPIRIRLAGTPSKTMMADLNALILRLRSEARLDIALTDADTAQITINAVSRKRISRYLASAACFVLPGVATVSEFNSNPGKTRLDWAQLEQRDRMGVFVPNDASPQEARDCLHEEIAQALGPVNDLYRLGDSVFNDDNTHAILTGFDMLMLRVHYDPALRTGMSRDEAARVVPGILARLNPRGERIASNPLPATPRSWIEAVQTTLSPDKSATSRRLNAAKALTIARSEGWRDQRLAFSLYLVARMSSEDDPARAEAMFRAPHDLLAGQPGMQTFRMFTGMQLAYYALQRSAPDRALSVIDEFEPQAHKAQNAALLSSFMMLRAEAYDQMGRRSEASAVRLDSLGWARYGFGPDWAVRARLDTMSSLGPKQNTKVGS
ncbi:DUF2927 domain-containing protein [Pseudoprimorskyibacter insulae]|uniref:ATP-dependent transcriptional regulator n=1 Tax=Pseudoprimorskyibacter insulae TaxID=1695997 RepID=A0A2R8AWB7_9RHOB|nr:DUF2927 domain-containing protein [Pseudoprimorskyibacter insulae]SPF80320.1 hypothetical protein PRI8871_02123 [Pseudoprimorskyibacter insulae]